MSVCAYPNCGREVHNPDLGLCDRHTAQSIAILQYGHRCAIPCEVCGKEYADLGSGRCPEHKGKIACTACGRPCKAGNKTSTCADCYTKSVRVHRACADCYTKSVRVHRACADCGGRVSKESKSGRCKDCWNARRYAEHRKSKEVAA